MARQPHNSQTVLREYVEQQRLARAPDEEFNDYFETLTAGLLLRDHALSEDEIASGIIGGGGDGGIDAMYVFVDDVLINEDTDLSIAKHGARVSLQIIQAKTERTFSEDTLHRLTAVCSELLPLATEEGDYADVYSETTRASFALFRSTYRALLRKAPSLSVNFYYSTFRPPNPISPGVQARCEALRQAVTERFPNADVNVTLLGAADLWDRIVRQPRQVRTLVTQRSSAGRNGYICLVSLSNLDEFLRDENGVATYNIFDENVRDWQGLTAVNAKISAELANGGERDFWWLNNGVTVICTEYRNDDNILTITRPQVVNGLQTCKEVIQYFDSREEGAPAESRSVLVKVIRVENDETRDHVIRATNNQNAVSVAMLRATDPFQRTIEQYLLPRDLYYERRKSFYSNRGRPSTKIVSLTYMAQAVLSLALFRPDDARARPSNPLSKDTDYHQVFNPDYPLNTFYVAAFVCRFTELYLKQHMRLTAKEVNNLRFYVAMVAVWIILGRIGINATALAQVDTDEVTGDLIDEAYQFVRRSYVRHGAGDDAARSSLLKESLRRRFQRRPVQTVGERAGNP